MTETILNIDTEAAIREVLKQLDGLPQQLKAPDVLAKAMNATASEIKRKLGQNVKKRYAITDTGVLKDRSQGGMYVKKASGSGLASELISKGPMLDVMEYMTRKNSGATAAMLKVLNSGTLTALEIGGRKAFETTFRSGHTAIVQRRGKERLPVKKLLAPAVPLDYGKTYAETETDYYTILQKHIQRQVEKVLDAQRTAA